MYYLILSPLVIITNICFLYARYNFIIKIIGIIGIIVWYRYLNISSIGEPIKNEYNDIPNIDQIEQELKEME